MLLFLHYYAWIILIVLLSGTSQKCQKSPSRQMDNGEIRTTFHGQKGDLEIKAQPDNASWLIFNL